MLNKDQYNQEEYNDYYRQEIEGAEIEGADEEEGSLISKLLLLLILLALSIAGYFGYKAMNDTSFNNDIDTSLQVSSESALPKTLQKELEKEPEKKLEEVTIVTAAEKPVQTVETKVAQEKESNLNSKVTKVVNTQGEMSPDEVAAVVAAVMKQMNQEKELNPTSVTKAAKKDVALINDLSNTELDSVSSDLIKELENIDINENTQIDNKVKQIDVYNKVNVEDVSGADTLSQLSDQINSVMAEEVTTRKVTNYTSSLKSELDVRKNEMRIIVVRKGDTLGLISKRAYGNMMDYKKIYRANPELTRPDRIYIGQKLRIPN